jgi:hypothetical protein
VYFAHNCKRRFVTAAFVLLYLDFAGGMIKWLPLIVAAAAGLKTIVKAARHNNKTFFMVGFY